ncbi:glycosyltransferase [Bradyrhizobium sp. Pear76]|uniref:glycosyltransferase n=1 Tax=Bradyrhizobium oropedii TaxID=1571201 RepID=UPI001E4C7415|nr:glycosyltransferase [Bradyrhizobium oropedii]MCC8961801.1 glycosyltransferase [Bradyrhizobium oropedii]
MNLLTTTSTVAISVYALLSTVHRSVQVLYALPTNVSSPSGDVVNSDALPSVDVIVLCFNEDPRTLSACLKSIASQDYAGKLRVYVVDDGSGNLDAVAPVHDAYSDDPRFGFILLRKNVGKRKAQIAVIRRSSGDLVLNVDSDTIIAADVVTKLARKMQDPAIGAAMGQLTASNRSDTWLTRLIDMEYWLACNEERAAQARFGAVMCCCGPCAMYRRSALLLLLDQYETQFFRGKPSDFGEDRYLTLDVVGQNLGPLLLALSSLTALAQLALTATVPWWAGLIIASMTVVRCSVAEFRARELRFLGFSLRTLINIFLLLPVKAYALCTLSNSDWLSRQAAKLPNGGKAGRHPKSGRWTKCYRRSGNWWVNPKEGSFVCFFDVGNV